ncbi:MAG TPA: hypothetical protein PKE12_03670 [Kiritimatiellia bacterium]|nr:hypothetical protein [Kiritimatiellia bacterium]
MAALLDLLPGCPRSYLGVVRAASWLSRKFPVNNDHGAAIDPDFYKLIIRLTGCSISHYRSEPLQSVKGMMLKLYDGKFAVFVSPKQSYCWRRFTLCKELCHVLTDGVWSPSGHVVTQLELASKPPSLTGALSSEDFCFSLAVEIMIPDGFRDFAVANRGRLTDLDLAEKIKAPEWVVTFFFEKLYATSCMARSVISLRPDDDDK